MIIFGLGNPGRKHERTRHNLGFMVLDELAHDFGVRFRTRGGCREAKLQIGGVPCALVQPLCFMNNSGTAVKEYLDRHHDDFVVACDDLALPFGRIRIRTRGSDGGHLGLANIIYHLATGNFPRLRIGIGAPPAGVDAADYVLSEPVENERRFLPEVLGAARAALVTIVEDGVTAAMNEFNGRELTPAGPESELAHSARRAAEK